MQFKDFFKKHDGKDFIVLGCGESVSNFVNKIPKDIITIGVNDIGEIFTPDYLLIANSPNTFNPKSRIDTILNNKSKYLITHLANKWPELPNEIIEIKLGNAKLGNIGTEPTNVIDYHNNSPYMACICAYYLGAKRIGLIGVDFTDNHFNNKDGVHTLNRKLASINDMYSKLHDKLNELGCELYNISPISVLTGLPKMNQDEFINPINKENNL